eukprot:1177500-Prorocentrum_minimum.AAC.4
MGSEVSFIHSHRFRFTRTLLHAKSFCGTATHTQAEYQKLVVFLVRTLQGMDQLYKVTTPSGNPRASRRLKRGPAKHAEIAIKGSVRATTKQATRSPMEAPHASNVWPKNVSSMPVSTPTANQY